MVAERFAAVGGRATAPGWRPLTDDVPETAAPGGAPPPRPFGALLRALAAHFGDGPEQGARSPRRRNVGSASRSTAGRPCPFPLRRRRKKPQRTARPPRNHKPRRPSPRVQAHARPRAYTAADAWLHNIAGEAYVVSPACFEAFAAGRDLAPATVRNRVVRLGRHRQRASPSGSANVFRAVLADGSRVKGMVFPGELIWDDDPPPRANAGLVGKGR